MSHEEAAREEGWESPPLIFPPPPPLNPTSHCTMLLLDANMAIGGLAVSVFLAGALLLLLPVTGLALSPKAASNVFSCLSLIALGSLGGFFMLWQVMAEALLLAEVLPVANPVLFDVREFAAVRSISAGLLAGSASSPPTVLLLALPGSLGLTKKVLMLVCVPPVADASSFFCRCESESLPAAGERGAIGKKGW